MDMGVGGRRPRRTSEEDILLPRRTSEEDILLQGGGGVL